MSQDIIDVVAALDEDIHEDEDDRQSEFDEDVVNSVVENQALLGEGKAKVQAASNEEGLEDTEDEEFERGRKELQFRQIVRLECSVKLLLASFEKGEAVVMIEDRIRECQRILIMIVGTDEYGRCL